LATQQYEEVTIKNLLESGAHFGHQTHRWNPKMKRFIFEARNGIYIIDLAKTMQQIRKGIEMIKKTVSNHRSILFVGTKKQAKAAVRDCAEESAEFYVCERWLGGMLTNLSTIRQSIKKLDRIEKRITTGAEGLTKKEISGLTKLQLKLERNLSGIRSMRKPPGMLIVVDPDKEHIAVAEANRLGIPVMALVDTNCDPDPIHHVIACNDDSLKSIKLILGSFSQAIIEQKTEMKTRRARKAKEDVKPDTETKEEKQEPEEEKE